MCLFHSPLVVNYLVHTREQRTRLGAICKFQCWMHVTHLITFELQTSSAIDV
jgi:hypothetical protein